MALDVEDCIDSVAHLDNESNWWRRMLPSCMLAAVPLVALDDVVATIDLLKNRIEAMEHRNLRYSHIADSSFESSEQMHPQAVANATALDILHARDPVCESSQVNLIKLINKNDGPLQVISVWGTGSDLGTASIIKKAYFDPEICEYFRCRAWVKLVHPFNPLDFIRGLVAQFCRSNNSSSQDEEGSSSTSVADSMVEMTTVSTQGVRIDEFMKLMSHHKYLVVLQGVSTMEDWETVRVYLPDNHNGSCIVINTDQSEVASLCVGQPHRVLELEKLSAHHSVYVLVKEVRSNHDIYIFF